MWIQKRAVLGVSYLEAWGGATVGSQIAANPHRVHGWVGQVGSVVRTSRMDRILCWLAHFCRRLAEMSDVSGPRSYLCWSCVQGPSLVLATIPRGETTASGVICLFGA